MITTQLLWLSSFKNFICKLQAEKVGDIDPGEMAMALQRFALILQKNEKLNPTHDFLNYLLKTRLPEVYPNVFIALWIMLNCPCQRCKEFQEIEADQNLQQVYNDR